MIIHRRPAIIYRWAVIIHRLVMIIHQNRGRKDSPRSVLSLYILGQKRHARSSCGGINRHIDGRLRIPCTDKELEGLSPGYPEPSAREASPVGIQTRMARTRLPRRILHQDIIYTQGVACFFRAYRKARPALKRMPSDPSAPGESLVKMAPANRSGEGAICCRMNTNAG